MTTEGQVPVYLGALGRANLPQGPLTQRSSSYASGSVTKSVETNSPRQKNPVSEYMAGTVTRESPTALERFMSRPFEAARSFPKSSSFWMAHVLDSTELSLYESSAINLRTALQTFSNRIKFQNRLMGFVDFEKIERFKRTLNKQNLAEFDSLLHRVENKIMTIKDMHHTALIMVAEQYKRGFKDEDGAELIFLLDFVLSSIKESNFTSVHVERDEEDNPVWLCLHFNGCDFAWLERTNATMVDYQSKMYSKFGDVVLSAVNRFSFECTDVFR